jgi:uncharacterized cupredoxin-like copper-binding protein
VAAEKSKVPFYIVGGVLAVWAVVVSVLLGMRKPSFPYSLLGQRAVMAISATLVLAAIVTAVAISGLPAKSGEASPLRSAAPAPAGAPSTSATTSGQGQGAATGRSTALALAANPTGALSYDKKTLSAKAGSVTITLSNASPLEHDVTIAQGSAVLGATPKFTGGSKSITLALKPGTYTFYCSVPGHRQAGMEGTLRVT